MRTISLWVKKNKDKINSFSALFISFYFIVLVFPYCTGRIPFLYQAICVSVAGRIAYRAIPTFLFFLYGVLVAHANGSRLKWEWLFPMLSLWVAYLLAWITTPDTYSYVSESWNRSLTYRSVTVGWGDEAIDFGTLVVETLLLLVWMSFIPDAINKSRCILIPIVTIISFAWLAVLVSLAIEWSLYVRLFQGGDLKLIRSFFSQKNEFGAFLFLGTFASSFASVFKRGKMRPLFVLSAFSLTIITFLVRCYTALISELLIVAALFVTLIAELKNRRPRLSYCLLGGTALVTITVIGLAFLPAVRESIAPLRIVYNSFASIEKEIVSRTSIWQHAPAVADGFHLFLGVTDLISDAKLASLQTIFQESTVAIFHNSYIAYLAIHGMVGLLVYFAVIFKAGKNCLISTKEPRYTMFLFALLLGYLFQGVTETYVLFTKMSVLTLPATLVFYVFLPVMRRNELYEI